MGKVNKQVLKYSAYGEDWKIWFKEHDGQVEVWDLGFHNVFEKFAHITRKTVKNLKKGFMILDLEEVGLEFYDWMVENGLGEKTGIVLDGYDRLIEFKMSDKMKKYVEEVA